MPHPKKVLSSKPETPPDEGNSPSRSLVKAREGKEVVRKTPSSPEGSQDSLVRSPTLSRTAERKEKKKRRTLEETINFLGKCAASSSDQTKPKKARVQPIESSLQQALHEVLLSRLQEEISWEKSKTNTSKASDYNYSSEKKDDTKTPEDRSTAGGCHRCWVCEVPLLLSYEDIHRSLISPSQSNCLYKSYPHPFLAMLSSSSFGCGASGSYYVCAVCADRVWSVEQEVHFSREDGCSLCGKRIQPQDNEDEEREDAENRKEGEEEELCTRKLTEKEMGFYFGEEESLLLLCDYCPRAFCNRCWKRFDPTFHDISELLKCPMCTNSGDESQSSEEKPKALLPAEKLDRSILSYLLEAYEAGLVEVENHLSLPHLIKLKEEIFQEFLDLVDSEEINSEAQQDLIIYRKLWELHALRLHAEIPVLQELLEIAGGSLHEFYQEFQKVKRILFPEEQNSIVSKSAEEKAISEANRYLQARDSSINCAVGASGYKASNERIYEYDLYPCNAEEEEEIDDDRYRIDDIQSLSDALDAKNHIKFHSCWRAFCSPKESMFQKALFQKALEEEERQKEKYNYMLCSNNDNSSDEVDRFRPIVHIQYLTDDHDKEEDGEPALLQQVRQYKESRSRAALKQSSCTQRREERKIDVLNDPSGEVECITNGRRGNIRMYKNYASFENSTTSSMTSSPKQVGIVKTLNQNKVRDSLDCFSDVYLESDFCLYDPGSNVADCNQSFRHSDTTAPLQFFLKDKVTVAEPIAKQLKEHQKEGIQFMWDNICGTHQDIHGCILAHNMGLGKSIQIIAFIHTLLTHPAIQISGRNCPESSKIKKILPKNRLIRTVLLLAPVNTLANWENEFMKWVNSSYDVPQLGLYPVYKQMNDQRSKMVERWHTHGGVLLSSPQKFMNIVNDSSEALLQQALLSPGPDLVIVDEAHGVFNKEGKNIDSMISLMRAPRRIALTGTPLQNNLYEYYYMVNWVRPGCLKSIDEFKKDYVTPIMDGLMADSSDHQKRRQEELIHDLYHIFRPFVHRKDSTILQQDLPILQQTVIFVRQSRVQQRILQLHQKKQKLTTKNFLDSYSKLKPVFNHPGTLLLCRPTSPSLKSCHEDFSRKSKKKAPKLNTLKNCFGVSTCETEMKDTMVPCDVKMASNWAESTAAPPSCGDEVGHHVQVRSMQVKEKQVESTSYQGHTCRTTTSKKEIESDIIFILDSDDEELAEINAQSVQLESTCYHGPMCRTTTSKEEIESDTICIFDSDDEEPAEINAQSSSSLVESQWWSDILRIVPDLSAIEHGGKMILILQILAQADDIGEKVAVFSHSLPTLDFIEKLLNQNEWEAQIPAISRMFPGKTWGPWKKNVDYVRIDGGTEASTRGELITQFNEENGPKSDNHLKLFLLSSRAGGVGINLVAATRVIIVDPHFNPTVDLQALYRCYRYGQTKPVFVYRLLCEGTMEEKVYRRQVNKTILSKSLIDRNNPARHFTARELDDIGEIDLWVQCDSCDKWRMLHPSMQNKALPEKWYCNMNTGDPYHSTCEAKERDQRWYKRYFDSECTEALAEELHNETQIDEKEVQTKRDTILCRILNVPRGEHQRVPGREVINWLSRYHFHEALLKDDPALLGNKYPSSRESTPAKYPSSRESTPAKPNDICHEDNVTVVPPQHFPSMKTITPTKGLCCIQ